MFFKFQAWVPSCLLLAAVSSAWAGPEVQVRDEGELYFENVPTTPVEVRERLRPYLNTRSATLAGWLPESGLLIRTRLGETTQVYRIHEPGGRREQLTFFDEPVQFAAPASIEGRPLALLLRDVGGSEDFQLFSIDLEDSRTDLLTDGDARHGAVVLSTAGDQAAYYSTRRNGRDWDIYLVDLGTGAERLLLETEGAWMPLDFDASDRRLLLLHVVSTAESHPWILDLETGSLERLFDDGGVDAYRNLRFGHGQNQLVLISDVGREFLSLFAVDLEDGELRLLADHPWDVTDVAVSPDGNELVYVLNEGGYGRLRRLSLPDGEPKPLPDLPEGIISGPQYHPDGNRIGFNFQAANVAGDVYSLDLSQQTVSRWTYSELGGLSADQFVIPQHVLYPTFDEEAEGQQRMIPAWVYRPRGEGPHPVIVEIHGGPAAQRRPGFSPTFQYWVNELGAAVVAPNVRGSSGYGKTYLSLDDWRLREDSVRDIGALLDWIAEQPELDESRVMVYGGSYGGYMVLASLMHFGDRLAGGVNIVGISNFVTFLENTRDYRRDLRRAEYGDERDPEMRAFLEQISPANHPERLTRPLFVIQGLNDPRVPASESEQIIAAMRSAGHNPWYMLARNEGHGFRRQSNREARAEAETLFIRRYLLPGN